MISGSKKYPSIRVSVQVMTIKSVADKNMAVAEERRGQRLRNSMGLRLPHPLQSMRADALAMPNKTLSTLENHENEAMASATSPSEMLLCSRPKRTNRCRALRFSDQT